MNISFKNTLLQVHPIFPGLILFSMLSGNTGVLFSLLALLLHECGHLFVMRLFGIMPHQITLTPFGGVMELPVTAAATPWQDFLCALAGPLFSFLGCLFCNSMLCHTAQPWLLSFFKGNLLLLLINLLPVWPLDGGRMLKALLSFLLPEKTLQKALTFLGGIMSFLFIGLSVSSSMRGELQFAPAFAGLYLLYASAAEGRKAPFRYYDALLSRRQRMAHFHPLPVQSIAAAADTPLSALPGRLKDNCYHLFHVLGMDGMQLLGTLTEEEFCALLMENSALTLQEALTKKQRSAV